MVSEPTSSFDPRNNELTAISDLLLQHADVSSALIVLDEFEEDLPDPVSSLRETFFSNLDAVRLIATLPYNLTHLALLPDAGELIRSALKAAWNTPASGGLVQILKAKNQALEQFNARLETSLGPGIRQKVVDRALQALNEPDVGYAVRELANQCLILTWAALEVLSRDTFITLLNYKPHLTTKIYAPDSPTKRIFGDLRIDLEILSGADFDLSTRMGDVVATGRTFDRLETFKAVFRVLFPDAVDLRESLDDHSLWLLYQTRHLLVHRRGIIDSQFNERTGQNLPVGLRVGAEREHLLSALSITSRAGVALLRAAAQLF